MAMIERASRTRIVVRKREGLLLVTSDLHGNFEDYLALRRVFDDLLSLDPSAIWASVGDWVHGPSEAFRQRGGGDGLYDYEDRSRDLVAELHLLEARYPQQFFSLLGNHEHAHIGGRPVRRFRPDEVAHLESGLDPDSVGRMRRMFMSWPLLIQIPSAGVILAHGAPDDDIDGPRVVDDVSYDGPCPRDSAACLEGILGNYGYVDPGQGRRFLDRMSSPDERYDLVVHGHDRHRDGGEPDGEHGYLLCTSFGARRSRKAYLVLDLARRYAARGLVEGRDVRRLYP